MSQDEYHRVARQCVELARGLDWETDRGLVMANLAEAQVWATLAQAESMSQGMERFTKAWVAEMDKHREEQEQATSWVDNTVPTAADVILMFRSLPAPTARQSFPETWQEIADWIESHYEMAFEDERVEGETRYVQRFTSHMVKRDQVGERVWATDIFGGHETEFTLEEWESFPLQDGSD